MGLNLHCTVCDKVLESKESWNSHLVEDSHQEVAREETSNRWWSDEQLRNTSLVLFSSVPLCSQLCGEVMSQFSKKVNVFVTDFVWWREKPKVAILQFESRKIAKEVAKRHGDTSVGGHRVQLKEAWTYLELELEEVCGIPVAGSVPDEDVSICEVEVVPVEAPIPDVIDLDVSLSPARDTVQPSPRAGPSSGGGSQSAIVTRLINDYEWIKKVMTYSKRSFDKLEVFIGSFKKLTRKQTCEAFLIRNHYLGIRYSSQPELIHVYSTIPGINDTMLEKVVSRLHDQFSLDKFEVGALFGAVFKSKSCPTVLNILTSGKLQKEVAVCRLILYLCRLDSRLRGVLTLVEFWAKYHELQVANNGFNPRNSKSWQCQDPLGLHLLVVVYLMKEKLLPSAECLQARSIQEPDYKVTFTEDDAFVDSWIQKNDCPMEGSPAWKEDVVQLTRDCFQFYSENLSSGRWLLSCYDGVILNYDQLQTSRGRGWPFIDSKERIYLAHPFDRKKRCAFNMETWETGMCPIMEGTAKRLTDYLSGKHMKLAKALVGNRDYHGKVQEWLDSCELRDCPMKPLM